MKSCIRYQDLMARFLHGDILRQEKDDLERHLDACPSCNGLYKNITEIDRVMREFPGKLVDPPPYLRGRILANLPEGAPAPSGRRIFGWAAALSGAAACVLIAVGVYRAGVPSGNVRIAAIPAPAPSGEPAGRVAAGDAARPAPADRPAASASRPAAPKVVVATVPRVQVIREVRIYFYYPPAQKVAVTGDFNGWNPDGVPLTPAGKPGLWETNLRLKPGAYAYNFIVDGDVLVPDPNAASQAPDGFGGTNSILLVKGGDQA